ncbi:complex I intermediate-associated protein 30-domain-containing protein [Aspergillus pseudodeflectus]|uniref:Complex I intermediate-associated protein 30-domain-containing protein n=1 Tax=Aspergillus pseudodeflectus TaxID=176178 RepID=A0ABR4K9W9_9EURO
MWSATSEKYLFGGPIPWDTQCFHAVDDRVRGGCSHSTLAPLRPKHTGDSDKDGNIAHFSGTLDTTTLGGAGFASQQTHGDLHWDLSDYDGIVLKVRPGGGARSAIGEGEVKKYTLLLKDSIPEKRPDGRERSAVCWEVDFRAERPAHSEGTTSRHYFKWSDFRATYRGRDCPDDEKKRLDIAGIKRVGFMVRSFFNEQSGDFSLGIESVAAYRKGEEYPYRDEPWYTSMGYKLGDETPKSPLNEKMPTRKRVQEMRYRDSPEDDTRTGDDGFVEDLRVTYLDPAESWSSWRYYLCGCI